MKNMFYILALFILISCNSKYDQYIAITMNYNVDLIDKVSAFVSEYLYFEPIRGFSLVADDVFDVVPISEGLENENFFVFPFLVYTDSLSQMIILSEIKKPINVFDTDDVFLISMEHYKEIFQKNIKKAMSFKYQGFYLNQFLMIFDEIVMVKVIFCSTFKGGVRDDKVFMIDYVLSIDGFTDKMLGVESSIASIGNKEKER